MQLQKNTVVQVTIHDLAFGGAGVGRWRGERNTGIPPQMRGKQENPASQELRGAGRKQDSEIIVFVQGGLPGDTVEARILRSKKNFCEAELIQILKKAPNRIAARCKHFDICGGCSLQNLAYEDQLAWKEKMVRDALERIGGIKIVEKERACLPPACRQGRARQAEYIATEASMFPIIGCDSPWFYRNKMEYSFGYEKKPEAPKPNDVKLGLHPAQKYHDVFDLEECFLMSELAPHIVDVARQWARKHKLEPYHDRRNEKQLRSLIVREGKNTGEIMVNLIYNGRDPRVRGEPLEDFTAVLNEKFPNITSIYATGFERGKGSKTKHYEKLLSGKASITETLTVGDTTLHFEILPEAFFQPNTKQAEVLYGEVLKAANALYSAGTNGKAGARDGTTNARGAAETKTPFQVLDLFCGTGTIGMFFAANGAKVTGIEISKQAVENAKRNASKNNLTNIEFHCGDVGTLLPKLAPKADLMITDPPRAGIQESTLHEILKFKIPHWIYVSCNPTTLARDLKVAQEHGYRVKDLQPVDMFPHTYHIETVATLGNL